MHSLLIVDDHDSFRTWARRVLSDEGFDVVGEAADGVAAIAECQRLEPDVVLLDVVLPDMPGPQVAAVLSAGGSDATVVLTSSRDLADLGIELGTTVAGFLPKHNVSGAALEAFVVS